MSRSRRYSSVYKSKSNSRSKKGNSRLLKKQEKEMRRQTIFFIFLSLALLLFFIFIIVPNLIRLFFNFFGNEATEIIENDFPPQTPILSEVPPEATFSAQLELAGYADPLSRVIFVINGDQVNEKLVNEDGEFVEQVQLDEGDNQLTIYAINDFGTESLQSKTYQIIFDDQAPPIEIIRPEPDTVIELKRDRITEVVGETEPLSKVYLNERLIVVDENGEFRTDYYLAEGENILKFVAIDLAGNQSELEIKVEFLNN
jgi:ABC-type sugar transport system permease subunit